MKRGSWRRLGIVGGLCVASFIASCMLLWDRGPQHPIGSAGSSRGNVAGAAVQHGGVHGTSRRQQQQLQHELAAGGAGSTVKGLTAAAQGDSHGTIRAMHQQGVHTAAEQPSAAGSNLHSPSSGSAPAGSAQQPAHSAEGAASTLHHHDAMQLGKGTVRALIRAGAAAAAELLKAQGQAAPVAAGPHVSQSAQQIPTNTTGKVHIKTAVKSDKQQSQQQQQPQPPPPPQPAPYHRGQAAAEDAAGPPVDVVYTWVDGSDPAWQARYSKVRDIGELKKTDKGRFVQFGEVLLSVASVHHMAPWVRTIFIATQDQRFDTSLFAADLRAKVRFVDHRDFIPAEHLPLFNSHAIEAFLHRIPGISDTFLYMNDDFFMVCPYRRAHVFNGGKVNAYARIEHKDPPRPDLGDDWLHSVWNSRMVVAEATGLHPYAHWHAGYLLTRASFDTAWSMFPGPLKQTVGNKVRKQAPLASGGDLTVPLLMVYIALYKGHQALNTSYMWAGWWEGRVVTNSTLYTAPSWQVDECLQKTENKPSLFVNVQTLADASEASTWCERAVREYPSAWAPGTQLCFCAQLPMGSACTPEARAKALAAQVGSVGSRLQQAVTSGARAAKGAAGAQGAPAGRRLLASG